MPFPARLPSSTASGSLTSLCEQPSSEPLPVVGQGSLLALVRKKRVDGFQVASCCRRMKFSASLRQRKSISDSTETARGRSALLVNPVKPSNVPMPAGNHCCKTCLWCPSPLQRNMVRCSDASPFPGWEQSDLGRGSGSFGRKPTQPQGK